MKLDNWVVSFLTDSVIEAGANQPVPVSEANHSNDLLGTTLILATLCTLMEPSSRRL